MPSTKLTDTTHDHFVDKAQAIAKDLRDIADKIDRIAEDINPDQGLIMSNYPFAEHASRVMHAVQWGFANLGLDTLIRRAGDADAALHTAEKQALSCVTAPTPSPEDKEFWAAVEPKAKVDILKAMGFTKMGSDHQPDCPYALDAGMNCNCIPPAPEWSAPNDVLEHLGETIEDRREKAKKPRPIPDVER